MKAVVVGCGRSLSALAGRTAKDAILIACNRAIEVVRADYWVWADRIHYERSKWHPHARRAAIVGNLEAGSTLEEREHGYVATASLPPGDGELFLSGGTLTAAAHFAVRQGARRVVFLACDAWDPAQDRYHAWDGAPLDAEGLEAHRRHLDRTAGGIRSLAKFYPDVQFEDATVGRRYLGLPGADLDDFMPSSTAFRRSPMPKTTQKAIAPDQHLPTGYGKLVSVTSLGTKESVLWFEDPAGTLRAIRMGLNTSQGLSLEIKGQAQVIRG